MNKPDSAILKADFSSSTFGIPNELLPLLGRSLTQRAIETIVGAGIRDIHVIVDEAEETTRMLLGSGARWGCRLHYHNLLPTETVSALVHRLGLRTDRDQLLADAAQLPIDITEQLRGSVPCAGLVWTHRVAGDSRWIGWGRLQGEWLARCALPLASTTLADSLLADTSTRLRSVPVTLSATTPLDILKTTDHLLVNSTHSVVIGRGSHVDPTARLLGPIWIGRNVRIGRDARIGPGVSIGDGALIEAGSILSNAMILPNTFVGEELAIKDAIAGGSRLASVPLDTVIDISDAHLLSHVAWGSKRKGTVDWGCHAFAEAAKSHPRAEHQNRHPRWMSMLSRLRRRWTKTHSPDYANARSGTQRRTA